jgi:peroxiredoxin
MTDPRHGALGPGDLAPDFTLPAADVEGTIALAEYLRRGPVFLTMLRGLYCPFCRRHISQLRPTCEALRDAGVAVLGVVLASPERARQYFGRFPACFPIAAASDRAIHRAYGLT